MVAVESLTRRYGKKLALDHLSLRQETRGIVGLLGRNGAGKSTLIRILTGQDLPSEGQALVFGEAPFDNPKLLSKLCLVPDRPEFGNLRTVEDLLSVSARIYPGWDEAYARSLLALFDLTDNKRLKALSRGMQTSLSLTLGLASRAELTIFDEPSLGLDAVMRERFYDALLKERKERDRCFILSTHLIEEVTRVLDEVIMIERGKLLTQGSASSLTRDCYGLSGPNPQLPAGAELIHTQQMAEGITLYFRGPKPDALAEGHSLTPLTLQRLFVLLADPAKGGNG